MGNLSGNLIQSEGQLNLTGVVGQPSNDDQLMSQFNPHLNDFSDDENDMNKHLSKRERQIIRAYGPNANNMMAEEMLSSNKR